MSILDTPFHFEKLSRDDLTLENLQSMGNSNLAEFRLMNEEMEHRFVHQQDSSISVPHDVEVDIRLKHLVIHDCKRLAFSSGTPFASANLSQIEDSSIDFGAVKGSVSLTACKNVIIEGCSSQLRLTDCVDVNIRVRTASAPALVNSSRINFFRPYEVAPESLIYGCLKKVNMLSDDYLNSNQWRSVVDFDSLANKAGSFVIHE